MNKTNLTCLLAAVCVAMLVSCSRSLSDYGTDTLGWQSYSHSVGNYNAVLQLDGIKKIGQDFYMSDNAVPASNYAGSSYTAGTKPLPIKYAPHGRMKQVDGKYVYPATIIDYVSGKTMARVGAVVKYDPVSNEPTMDMCVFDMFGDSLAIYGGMEQMGPRSQNAKKGEWTFEGEVALLPTPKDVAKQRERYMKYKLTYSPKADYLHTQSYKVKTRKVAK